MITELCEIENYSPFLLLYPAGASGEAVAYAITQSFPEVSKSPQHWENHFRCKILDFFNRSLTTGFDQITPELVVQGVNIFLSNVIELKSRNIALAHQSRESLTFILEYIPEIPVIEIVTYTKISKKFRYLGIQNKIETRIGVTKVGVNRYTHSGIEFTNHLRLEWSDIFFSDSNQIFLQIAEFLNMSGNANIFQDVIDDYKLRNKDLIQQSNES